MKKVRVLGLVKGRHELPCNEFVFDNQVNPLDSIGLEEYAKDAITAIDEEHIELFVTGLTVALVAVSKACIELGKGLTLMHYDNVAMSYYKQEFLSPAVKCGFCHKDRGNGWYCGSCGST